MSLQVEKKWQASTRKERFLGRQFIRHVFESLGVGSEVTETMLDLVVKELFLTKGIESGAIQVPIKCGITGIIEDKVSIRRICD